MCRHSGPSATPYVQGMSQTKYLLIQFFRGYAMRFILDSFLYNISILFYIFREHIGCHSDERFYMIAAQCQPCVASVARADTFDS